VGGTGTIDLRQEYEVRLDEGLDTFVVVDGCPIVPEDSRAKLIKFLCKKLADAGRTRPDAVFMPLNEGTKNTQGYVLFPPLLPFPAVEVVL
jgi:translation initiation factor 3 subunit B